METVLFGLRALALLSAPAMAAGPVMTIAEVKEIPGSTRDFSNRNLSGLDLSKREMSMSSGNPGFSCRRIDLATGQPIPAR